jgi:hypothetical protein
MDPKDMEINRLRRINADLLAALRGVIGSAQIEPASKMNGVQLPAFWKGKQFPSDVALDAARAAIARAEGREP